MARLCARCARSLAPNFWQGCHVAGLEKIQCRKGPEDLQGQKQEPERNRIVLSTATKWSLDKADDVQKLCD